MIVVVNRIPVKKDYWDEFETRFQNRAGLVDRSPGFIRNLVLRPVDNSSHYHVIMTWWENKEAFEAWTQSPAFKEAHAAHRGANRDMYAGPNVFEMHEVVTDTSDGATSQTKP
ncbi:MAG: antibiotic biosynthesis monooxygenase [Magnetococcales bacterium]|nr:antibiotic biosynthesis monooxygenase [Magnetococcales bacterium]